MLYWTHCVLSEYWAQGDKEQTLQVPISPLCERASGMSEIPKGQMGFIQFVIEPFYKRIAEIIPELQEALDTLEKTKAFWKEQEQRKAMYDDVFPAELRRLLDPD